MSLDETVLITGFPGFIASRLVKRLALEGAQFLLLVQPTFADRAAEEVSRIAVETSTPVSRFRIVEGDVTKTNLGLRATDLDIVRNETTVLFHLAAVYDLAVNPDVALSVNVDGTRNVNQFALNQLTKLRRYHYVSTCYVAGLRKGVILETELEHNAGFRNYYEESKYLAEIEVEALKKKLPVTIHRPAVVCGDSQTGETAKYDGIYYLIHYIRKQPGLLSLFNIGNSDVRLNLVPVDFVVEAMTALVMDEKAIGSTVQLADPAPLTTKELFDAIAQTIAGHPSRVAIPAALVFKSLMLPFSEKLTGLPRSAVPYFFLEQTYDSSLGSKLLEPHGVRCPPFPSYVDRLVSFVASHPKL
jgi:nucleoside-diphosphate-sugar epimerase